MKLYIARKNRQNNEQFRNEHKLSTIIKKKIIKEIELRKQNLNGKF